MADYISSYDGTEVDTCITYAPRCVTLSSVPTSSTLTYTVDTSTYDFKIGDLVTVANANISMSRVFRLVNISSGTALWEELQTANHQRIISSTTLSWTTEWDPYYVLRLGTMTSISMSAAVFAAGSNNIRKEWNFSFYSGSTATTLSLPNTIKWRETLIVEANTYYEVSIMYEPSSGSLLGLWADYPNI